MTELVRRNSEELPRLEHPRKPCAKCGRMIPAKGIPQHEENCTVGVVERECSSCKAMKPITAFPICRRKTGTRLRECRTCMNARRREIYQKEVEALKHFEASLEGRDAES